jgi:hypothetical protein
MQQPPPVASCIVADRRESGRSKLGFLPDRFLANPADPAEGARGSATADVPVVDGGRIIGVLNLLDAEGASPEPPGR